MKGAGVGVRVRVMEAEDWALLKRLRLAALATDPGAFTARLETAAAMSDAEWQARAAERAADPQSVTFFVGADSAPVGMAACRLRANGEGELLALWVEPAARRLGAGAALANFAADWAADRGARRLLAGVAADNEGALRFYAAAGFTEVVETFPHPHRDTEILYVGRALSA